MLRCIVLCVMSLYCACLSVDLTWVWFGLLIIIGLIGLIGGTCLFSLVCKVVFWLDC